MKVHNDGKIEYIKSIVTRIENGENKVKLAKEAGVTYNTINRWSKDPRYNNNQLENNIKIKNIKNEVETKIEIYINSTKIVISNL